MFAPSFDPVSWDDPQALLEVDLLPSSAESLAHSGSCEDQELKRDGSATWLPSELAEKSRQLAVRNGGVVDHTPDLRAGG